MRKTLGILLTSALLVGSLSLSTSQAAAPGQAPPPAARGKSRFVGPHPLAGRANAGYCYIDVPHSHNYAPDRPNLYQQVGDSYVFTGDPVPFGYEGQKSVFYGHHPVPAPAATEVVPVAAAPTFCFLKGPHYHDYPQPSGPGYKVKDDVVFYVGPIPPPVAAVRPQIEQATEVEYRPYVALRPKVTVVPPPEWPGVVWVAPPAPTVVAAPAAPVVVAPAAPQVVVAPAAPPVVVAPPAPAVIVAPAHPTVVIGAPAPVIIRGHGKGKGWKGGRGWGHFGGKGHWKH